MSKYPNTAVTPLRVTAALIFLFFLFTPLHAFAKETPIPPAPKTFVTDKAGFLSPGAVGQLDAQLESYSRASGKQVLVYIDKTTGDAPIEDWAARAFKAWKVGDAKLDNGLVLFVMADDHRLRIEVGYGLEGTIPDALAARVINDVIVPGIKAGNNDVAIASGLQGLVGVLGGDTLKATPQRTRQQRPQEKMTLGKLIFLIIAVIGFGILFKTNPALATLLLVSMMSGGRGGGHHRGGGGGGGGFSGGGGSSGGGGASGSW